MDDTSKGEVARGRVANPLSPDHPSLDGLEKMGCHL